MARRSSASSFCTLLMKMRSLMALLFWADAFAEQVSRFVFYGQDVGADFLEGAERLGLVEVTGEADFVADFGGIGLDPGVVGIRQHFAADEGFDALLRGGFGGQAAGVARG